MLLSLQQYFHYLLLMRTRIETISDYVYFNHVCRYDETYDKENQFNENNDLN